MPDLLSASDLLVLRTEWIGYLIDRRVEWGTAPKVGASASAGASSLQLAGLGTGTSRRGATFSVTATGARYTVTADQSITAGAATVSISPVLVANVTTNDLLSVDWKRVGAVARVFDRLAFEDVHLQDLALRADQLYGVKIAQARDPLRMRYQAITLLAFRALLTPGSEFREALRIADPSGQGKTELDSLEQRVKEYEAVVADAKLGMKTTSCYR